jgi:hypothetical protein
MRKYAVKLSVIYYSVICPDGIRKIMKPLGRNISPSDTDMNVVPAEYELGGLYNPWILSVVHFNIILLQMSMFPKQSPSFPHYE